MNILITGGSRGLGLEVAKQQLAAGNHVYLVSRTRTPDIDRLAIEFSDRVFHLQFDLANIDEIKASIFKRMDRAGCSASRICM